MTIYMPYGMAKVVVAEATTTTKAALQQKEQTHHFFTASDVSSYYILIHQQKPNTVKGAKTITKYINAKIIQPKMIYHRV